MKPYLKHVVILFTSLFMLGDPLSAKSMVENNVPLLVLDEKMHLSVPKRFRTCQFLKIAGSAQFSKETLGAVIKEFKGPVWVIDLRNESHGFVNDLPVSWYGKGNQSNGDMSIDTIQKQEAILFEDIKRTGEIFVSQILEKESGHILKTRSIDLKVKSADTEATLLSNFNMGYLRIGVLDHHRPSDAAVDEFLDFVKKLPPEAWLYFHCRGGAGRTTTFMVMYDIMKNAHKLSLNDIVQRQALLGGNNILEISQSEDDAWKKKAAIERKHFIEKFYKYVHDPEGFQSTSWRQWAILH